MLFEKKNHLGKSTQKRSACKREIDKKISENHEVYIKTRKKWDFFYRNVKIIKNYIANWIVTFKGKTGVRDGRHYSMAFKVFLNYNVRFLFFPKTCPERKKNNPELQNIKGNGGKGKALMA